MGILTKPKDILPFHIARAAIAALPFELLLNRKAVLNAYNVFWKKIYGFSWGQYSSRAVLVELLEQSST
jgi:hypothetical protein